MKLTSQQKKQIVEAISAAERETSGEIRVHLAHTKCDEEILVLAQKRFADLQMHVTTERNGVLLYLSIKERKFALYGDQGIHERVGQAYWENLRDEVSQKIKNTDIATGICHAVAELGKQLKTHFPYQSEDKNELDNEISESE